MSGKVAIVSGGGTGIGAAISRRLGRDGLTVVVAYSRSADGAQAVVDDIVAAGGIACSQRVDIAQERQVIDLFAAVKSRYGRIDVVVNNAGIGHQKPFEQIGMEEYDAVFAVNTRGTFAMCREAARHIEAGGRIINISTGATQANSHGMSLYVGSKAAVEAYSKVLARELGPRGVAVNSVSPGMTNTPMLDGGDAQMLKQFGAQAAAMGRCGEPEDIADAVAMLVSNDGRWITGQTISVSGGMTIV